MRGANDRFAKFGVGFVGGILLGLHIAESVCNHPGGAGGWIHAASIVGATGMLGGFAAALDGWRLLLIFAPFC
jgi:hypothetical protein